MMGQGPIERRFRRQTEDLYQLAHLRHLGQYLNVLVNRLEYKTWMSSLEKFKTTVIPYVTQRYELFIKSEHEQKDGKCMLVDDFKRTGDYIKLFVSRNEENQLVLNLRQGHLPLSSKKSGKVYDNSTEVIVDADNEVISINIAHKEKPVRDTTDLTIIDSSDVEAKPADIKSATEALKKITSLIRPLVETS